MAVRPPTAGERARYAGLAILTALAAFAWAVFAALANRHWYAGLFKPTFAPGPWTAFAAWALASLAASRGFYRVLCRPDYLPDRAGAIRLHLWVLALTAVWSWAFFVGRHPALSVGLAAVLILAALAATWRVSAIDRRAAMLLVPLDLVALLAGLVDLSISRLNG